MQIEQTKIYKLKYQFNLYDKNSIKVNIDAHIQSNNLERFELQDIFNNTYLYTKEESERILAEYKENSNVLKIYYQLLGEELIPYKINL